MKRDNKTDLSYLRAIILLMVSLCGWVSFGNAMSVDTETIIVPVQYLTIAQSTVLSTETSVWDKRFSQGLSQTMEGNYADAEKNYQDILKTASDDSVLARAILCLGELYEHYTDEPEKAKEKYNEVIQKYGQTGYAELAKFNLAVVDFHQKKYTEAYSQFSTYLNQYPEGRYRDSAKFMSSEVERILGIAVPKLPPIIIPTTIPKIEGNTVRIAVLQKTSALSVTSDSTYTIWSGDTVTRIRLADGGNDTRIRLTKSGWKVGQSEITTNRLIVVTNSDKPLKVENKSYRGQLHLIKDDGQITVVNVVSLEEYLYSVVPKEVSDNWPMEALKAQAVAARTYVLSRIAVRLENEYDVVNSEMDQVYGGYASERPRTTQAVDETKGEILTYDGEPILSYFHANSGGHTEDALSAFGLLRPYLKAVSDPYSKNAPGYRWTLRMSATEIQKRLKAKGLNIGTINSILVSQKTPGGRIKKITIFHSKGITSTSAVDFRWKIASTMLRSTMFTVRKEGRSYLFSGKGYGHGVGLSQWGCYNMAKAGKKYISILSFYYPGAQLNTL